MVVWPVDNRVHKAERTDETFSRSDFAFDRENSLFYVCPAGKELRKYHRAFSKARDGLTSPPKYWLTRGSGIGLSTSFAKRSTAA
jgi:hypothetical protein